MTLRLALMACVVSCAAVCCRTAASAEPFPYMAYVNTSDVYIRSGPGEKYYPVAKVDRGAQIEVYRHDPGGWYAIRPPDESFSWVSAEFIELREGNIGMVSGDRVAARVGSSFSDTRDVIQVRLNRGEEVEILEVHETGAGAAAQIWYRIAPPAGEFRWISARHVEREIAETRGRDELDHDPQIRRTDFAEEDDHTTKKVHRRRKAVENEDDENDTYAEIDERPLISAENRRPKTDLKEEAEELDLTLSAIVVGDPVHWDFTALRSQAEDALDRAETALQRGRIRRVLRKIDNFSDIRQRYVAVMSVRGTRRSDDSNVLSDRSRVAALSRAAQMRYDGVGRLTQISSVDPHLPQYALIDTSGEVAAYVSPAPGVNLRRYLNQDVGINGTIGYLPERHATHLTAKRIVPVDSRPIR